MSPPPAPASASPLSISATHTSIREFIHDVQRVCLNRYGIDAGYRQVSRIYHKWKLEECARLDDPRMGQDKQMSDDPTGETAIRRIMRELATASQT